MCFSFDLCVLLYQDLVGERVICCMMVRIGVHSKVRGENLVLMVRIILRVFLQKYTDCLEKKCVLMIGDFEYMLALLEVLGMLSVGTGVGLFISNFGRISKLIFYEEILCLL